VDELFIREDVFVRDGYDDEVRYVGDDEVRRRLIDAIKERDQAEIRLDHLAHENAQLQEQIIRMAERLEVYEQAQEI